MRDDEGVSQRNPDGTVRHESMSTGWAGVAEAEVNWTVSGGSAPYTLMIDGETRDASGDYRGANGAASVSCALAFSDSFIHEGVRGTLSRPYAEEPTVDSGLKTIEVAVRDGEGNTGSASLVVYVVVNVGSGALLRAGGTYRVFGWYLTVPVGRDMEVGSSEESDCQASQEDLDEDPHFCENSFTIVVRGGSHCSYIIIGEDSGRDRGRSISIDASRTSDPAQVELDLNADFDKPADSVGQTLELQAE